MNRPDCGEMAGYGRFDNLVSHLSPEGAGGHRQIEPSGCQRVQF